MGEPKVFASLSSGLLARKGAARPAMRPQGFGQVGATLEDLGWNDMGFEPPRPTLTAVRDDEHDAFGDEVVEHSVRHVPTGLTPSSPVHGQHAELAVRFAGHDIEPGEEEEDDPTAEPFDALDKPVADVVLPVEPVPQPAPVSLVPEVSSVPQASAAPRRASAPRRAPGLKAKAAFTLRLEPARHLKLRLACAVSGRSAQLLVTDALDQLLASMPELDGMAARAPAARKAG